MSSSHSSMAHRRWSCCRLRRHGRLSRIDWHQTSWPSPNGASHIHAARLNSRIRNSRTSPAGRNRRSHRHCWAQLRRCGPTPMSRTRGNPPSRCVLSHNRRGPSHCHRIGSGTRISHWHLSYFCSSRFRFHLGRHELRWWRHWRSWPAGRHHGATYQRERAAGDHPPWTKSGGKWSSLRCQLA